MQFLYDNLTATVVGTTVLLILIAIQMRATRANVEQMSRSIAFGQAETMATWLEEDLSQMGRNIDGKPFTFPNNPKKSEENGSPTDETLNPDSEADFKFEYNDKEIQYTLRYADGESPPYELDRSVSGGGGGTGSAGRLGYFDIEFINKNASPTSDVGNIQAIRVRYSVVTPFQNDDTMLREIHRMIVVPYPPAQD
jgi:hypothetical protein